jgi:ABC-type transport system substrate-binding protein
LSYTGRIKLTSEETIALFKHWSKRIACIVGSCFIGMVLFLAALTLFQQPGAVRAGATDQQRAARVASSADQSLANRPAAASGTFTNAFLSDITGLDPILSQSDGGTAAQIYETLVKYQTGGSIPVPGLAQSWTVSTNGLTWTFTLQPGVKFHDGTDLTAAAVVSNVQRWWDPANPFHVGNFWIFAWAFGGFKGSRLLVAECAGQRPTASATRADDAI